MKTKLVFLVISMLLYGSVSSVAMATTTPASAELMASLTAQIAVLQAKIVELKTAQMGVQTSMQNVQQTLRLIGDLKEGMTSEDVRLVQALLASDASIYPEQTVSGYYGKLTAKAIKRFQKRHGLPETGYTGPLTREKLNQQLMSAPIARETAVASEHNGWKSTEPLCLSVPPGHLVAPGWKRNKGDVNDSILPLCKKLPPGIAKKLEGGTTTPPVADTTAPTISAITVGSISAGGAVLSWTTNEQALSKLYLSTMSPVGTATPKWMEGSYTLSHSATLSGLLASTNYHALVSVTDMAGNTSFSAPVQLMTSQTPDVSAPVISALTVTNSATSSASVTWMTNEGATSRVYYGTTSPLNLSTASTVFMATYPTSHSLALSGLATSSTYYIVVESRDVANNIATSSQTSFITVP